MKNTWNIENIRFSNPPLNEVLLDISFSNVKWNVEHFGLYFQKNFPKFSNTKIQHPLPSAGGQQTGLALLTEAELPRTWYEFQDKSYVLQVQKDRFILNWRKVPNLNNSYPFFNEFYSMFETEWKNFLSFCSAVEIGEPNPARIELVYINHLVKGTHWNNLEELGKYFKSLTFIESYSELNMFSFNVKYLVNGVPTLQSYKPAKSPTGEDLYIVELKAAPQINSLDNVQTEIKKANNILVEQFLKITSDLAHKNWGLSGV
jgi:uncharacterized protein (TIGR04255 family)